MNDYLSDDSSKCDIVTTDTVEQLINEIGKIKTQMNSTELQLYEANEKIAELIDNVSEYPVILICYVLRAALS